MGFFCIYQQIDNMPNTKNSALNKILRNLYLAPEDINENFSEREMQRKHRIMLCVAKKLDNPLITDKELVEYLIAGCDGNLNEVSKSTAYRDIGAVSEITGNVKLAAIDWYRYMLVEGAKEGFAIAKNMKDARGIAANLTVIMKTTKADKDNDKIDFDQLIPPSFEPTDDISILGDEYTEIEDLESRRSELRKLLKPKAIQEVKIVEDGNSE